MDIPVAKTASPIDATEYQVISPVQAGPGAGAPLVYTVPAATRIYLLAIDITLLAISAGPAKVLEVALADITGTYAKTTIGTGTSAVTAINVHLAHEIMSINSIAPPSFNWRPLPFKQILNPGDTITITIINGGANDQITQAAFRAQAWIDP